MPWASKRDAGVFSRFLFWRLKATILNIFVLSMYKKYLLFFLTIATDRSWILLQSGAISYLIGKDFFRF
jgi:hypothetical protein